MFDGVWSALAFDRWVWRVGGAGRQGAGRSSRLSVCTLEQGPVPCRRPGPSGLCRLVIASANGGRAQGPRGRPWCPGRTELRVRKPRRLKLSSGGCRSGAA